MVDGKKKGLRDVKREFPSPLSLLSPPKAVDARPRGLRRPMPRNLGEKFMCQPSEILRTRTSRHQPAKTSVSPRSSPPRETSPAAKNEEKRIFSQASGETYECVIFRMFLGARGF